LSNHQSAKIFLNIRSVTVTTRDGGTGGPHGSSTHTFSGGPRPPLLHFEFCLNKFK